MQNGSRLNIPSVVTRASQDSLKTGGDVLETENETKWRAASGWG